MFRFRLQRVLELRERKERDAATELVQARDDAERARAEQARLEAARAELATRDGSGDGASSVGALRTLHFLLGRLDERVAHAESEATTAEHVVAQRQDALTSAFRDRRTLDRLRERHTETWRAAEAAADLRQMDEIALTRFAKPKSSPPSSDEK